MSETGWYLLLSKAVFFICVTIAAMYFEKAGILWWYTPGILSMLVETVSTAAEREEEK